jgi:hypothetical protein
VKLKQVVAKATVAAALVLPTVGLGIGVANHPPSPPQVPIVPNVPSGALPGLPTAAVDPNGATAMANGNQAVPATPATPFGGERTRSSGVTALNPPGWPGVTPIPLLGPLGGLLG